MKGLAVFLRIALFALLVQCVTAQHEHHASSEPSELKSENTYLLDEFGKLGHCDLTSRFDNLFSELSNRVYAQGYAIFYNGADALPGRYGESYLARTFGQQIMFRNFDRSRVTIVDGGFREEASMELWIVPDGGDIPEPSRTVSAPTIPVNKTFLFDSHPVLVDDSGELLREFELPSVTADRKASEAAAEAEYQEEERLRKESGPETPDEPGEAPDPRAAEDENDETLTEQRTPEETLTEERTPEEIESERFDWTSEKFGDLLANRKDSSGLIIFYADDQTYDIGRLRQFIEQGRNRIAEAAEISIERVSVEFGGYRGMVEAEFWIVSRKGAKPLPKPEERPVDEEEEPEASEN